MTSHRLAYLAAVAGDEVEHAPGQADVMEHFSQDEGVERSLLGGLEDHRAPGGECRRYLANDLVEWEVPGGDHRDHADGLLDYERVANLLLPHEAV